MAFYVGGGLFIAVIIAFILVIAFLVFGGGSNKRILQNDVTKFGIQYCGYLAIWVIIAAFIRLRQYSTANSIVINLKRHTQNLGNSNQFNPDIAPVAPNPVMVNQPQTNIVPASNAMAKNNNPSNGQHTPFG